MSDDKIKQPWDKRSGEQFAKDQQAVNEVTEKILKPLFKEAPDDDLTKLIKWRDEVRTKVRATLAPIIDIGLMRSPVDPENPHTPSGRAKLLVTAHKLYLDECRKLSKDEAIFLLAFMYGERTVEDFI